MRLSLSHKARREGYRVFEELHRRFDRAVSERRSVVLDSTGMSHRFRALLRAHRNALVHVHLVLNDPRTFEERERLRTDRPGGALPFAAFARSRNLEFHDAPDIIVETDELAIDETYRKVNGLLQALIR